MLIKFDDQLAVVIESRKSEDKGTYVALIPYISKGVPFVEVEIIDQNDAVVIKGPLSEWKKIEDNREGYPRVADLRSQLYYVWDDGASEHPRAAKELQHAFETVIDAYREPAKECLNKIYQEEYDRQLSEARAKGWEWSSIEKKEATFPYEV